MAQKLTQKTATKSGAPQKKPDAAAAKAVAPAVEATAAPGESSSGNPPPAPDVKEETDVAVQLEKCSVCLLEKPFYERGRCSDCSKIRQRIQRMKRNLDDDVFEKFSSLPKDRTSLFFKENANKFNNDLKSAMETIVATESVAEDFVAFVGNGDFMEKGPAVGKVFA